MKPKLLFVSFFVLLSSLCFSKGYRISDSRVSFKDVCIRLLSPTMFSVQNGKKLAYLPTVDLGVVNLKFNKVTFSVKRQNNSFLIRTDSLDILYNPALDITKGGLKVFLRHNPKYVLNSLSDKDTLNLGGVIESLDNCKGNLKYDEQNDVSSKSHLNLIPDGILSRRGFTVLKHTRDSLYLYGKGDRYNELYVMAYGDNYKGLFADFYSLAGKIPMLPKWSLGLIYSRWKDYNADDYKKIVHRFREEKMPIDAIILDMCWHVDYWNGYRYDTHNFPDMKAFHLWTDSVHVKTGFNHHPGRIYYKDPHIGEFCRKAGLDYNSALLPGFSWEADKKVIHYDTKNKRHFNAFYEIYLSHLIKDGLDFHWVDGESSIYSSELYQKYLSEYTHKRPVVMNRLYGNVLCNHRYPFGFSGDTYISWETMKYSLEVNIKGGNNGVYWSHDIGGYMPQGPSGYAPTGEIFARWLQLGAVSPILRVHAKKDVYWTPPCKPGDFDEGSRLPWEWGDTILNSAKVSIQLRYKLLPYIYTMTRNAYDSGMPLCRGLYINYPQADKAYRYDEYLFGDDFLVAPIMGASHKQLNGITERSLWLPDGDWYDYFTNRPYRGNEDISVEKALNEFPLFVKGGSIIPMAPYQDYSGAPLDTLLLYAYTPAKSQKSTFNLYEDDGETFLFEKHQFRWIKLSYEYTDHSGQKIVIGKPSGNFAGSVEKRAYKIYIVNTDKPQRLYVNGKALANWSWDASQRVLTMNIDQQDINSDVTIEAQL